MASRSRRGKAFGRKQQKYTIVDDDDDDDDNSVEESGSKDITEDSSNNNFGGVLASLNNKPPPKKKCLQKNASKPPVGTPQRKTLKNDNDVAMYASPCLPTSIVLDKKTVRDISPLSAQVCRRGARSTVRIIANEAEEEERTTPKSHNKKKKRNSTEAESENQDATLCSNSSDSSSDADTSEQESISVEETANVEEKSVLDAESGSESSENSAEYDETVGSNDKTTEQSKADGEEEEEEDDDDELDMDGEGSKANEGDQSTSEEEFEFDGDEDFDPDEEYDGTSECESSEDDLSDFIVEDTPVKKKRAQRKVVTRSATKSVCKQKPDVVPNSSPQKSHHTDESSMHEDVATNSTERTPNDITREIPSSSNDETNEKLTTHPDSTLNDTPSTATRLQESPSSHETSNVQSDPDEAQSVSFLRSPATLDGGDETEVEETPAKFTSTRKTLDFDSPEPQMAMIVDDDDNDLDDVLVATIVDTEDVLESERIEVGEKNCDKDADAAESAVRPTVVSTSPTAMDKNSLPDPTLDTSKVFLTYSGTECIAELDKPEVLDQCDKKQKCDRGNRKDQPRPQPTQVSVKETTTIFYRQEGSVKRGKWTLGAQIGRGSFGNVYVGMNTYNGVLMAVKKFCMKSAIMKDIRTEVELLRSLHHKNIVRYYGAQMDRKNLHVFQEWVPGGSVEKLLERFGPFTIEVIQSYLSQALAGLSYLHKNDVMHRDIKGSNILVNDEGVVKLADFGASKKLAKLEENLMMTMTVRGTPYFMAPEVFEEKYSAKADVWGIGCVACQMVTGRPPWKDRGFTNPISLFNHIKKTKGPPPMTHPDIAIFSTRQKTLWNLLQELVNKCFDHDPSNRPTAVELESDTFFLTVHDVEDENNETYRGLFSPGHDITVSFDAEDTDSPEPSVRRDLQSPSKSSPVSESVSSPGSKLQRSRSVVQWKSSFLTPPRPKRTPQKNHSDPSKRTRTTTPRQAPESLSPSPDARNWPDWARAELKKQIGSQTSPIPEVVSSLDRDLSHMMGSLALSEDSEGFTPAKISRNEPSSFMGKSDTSNLVGLNYLESSNDTYEI
jgi:serine/threonine protein kinase